VLAREDRYYLLVKVMKRVDCLHPWIYARCREVEESPDNHLDLWAREHYKSTIITVAGSIQNILQNPEITIGIFSHTKPIARAFLRQIKREFESNVALKKLFPDIVYDDPRDSPGWSEDSGIIVKRKTNPKEATVEAWGLVDGQPTSKHYTLVVYDDVVTRESVSTHEQVQKTTEAWELSDNLSAIGGKKWYVGTRYSYADTYEDMLKRGIKARLHPATDNGQMDGKPVLFTQEVWEEKCRIQGEATISCQMLQNPLAGKQRMFDVEDIGYYEIRPETLNVYIMVDPARSVKRDSAKTAMAVVGVDYAGNKYLLDGYNHRMDLQGRWVSMRNLWVRWHRQPGIQACKVGYEKFGAQADLDYFAERMKMEGVVFGIDELAWPRDGDGSKVDRVQRLGPDFKSHKFFVPMETDGQRLTTAQRRLDSQGYGYRIAKPIRRKNENNEIYDLTKDFKNQVHYFPYTTYKDLIDAVSRIYDLAPSPPIFVNEEMLEPTYT